MNGLIIFVVLVLILQIALWFVGRRIRKKNADNNVLMKYNIKTRHDAWKALTDNSIPEEDRKKIEELYHGEEDGTTA